MRDMKNYRASGEDDYSPRLSTYLMILALVALLSWFTERDNHPLNMTVAKVIK